VADEVIKFTIEGVDKGSGVLDKFTSKLGATGKAVGIVVGAVAAAASGIALFANKVAESEDKVKRMADVLDITTESLSRLGFAAEREDISIESLSSNMQRMSRNIADAADGVGDASMALSKMGLSAQQLETMLPDEQLRVLADALQNVESQSDKLQLSIKLFGRSGAEMLRFLQDGSEGLDKMAALSDRFGVTVSTSAAVAAEKFTHQMFDMEQALKGVALGVGNKLIPIVGDLTAKFTDFLVNNRENIMKWVDVAIRSFLTFSNVLGQIFTTIKENFTKLFTKEGFDKMIDEIIELVSYMIEFFARAMPIVGSMIIEAFNTAFEVVVEMGKTAWMKVFDLATGQQLADTWGETIFGTIAKKMDDNKERFSMMMQDMGTVSKDVGTEVSDNMAEVFGVNLELAQAQTDAYLEKLTNMNETQTAMNETQVEQMSEFYSTLSQLSTDFFNKAGSNQKQYATLVFKSLQDVSKGIGQAFAQVIMEGGKLRDALVVVLKQVVQNLISGLIEIGVQRLILSRLTQSTTMSETSQAASSAIGLAGANMFKSWAGAPWPVSLGAPAAAAGAVSGAAAAYSAGAAVGRGLGAVAHGGLDNVPSEATYFLDKGERVLSPRQNRDLTDFLSNGGSTGGSGTTIENLSITLFDSSVNPMEVLNSMSKSELMQFISDKLIPAMDKLSDRGVRPKDLARQRSI
jgi:hypothetical protein